MAVDTRGSQSQIFNQESGSNNQVVTVRWPYIGSNGAYALSAQSGLITTIAAGTATAGGLFCMRWTHSTKLCILTRFLARWVTVAGFTSAQEVGMDLLIARGWSGAPSAGTSIVSPSKKRASHAASQFASGDIRIATAAAITHGSPTLDTNPIRQNQFSELANIATGAKGFFSFSIEETNPQDYPIVFAQNEGLILRNQILMGAGGTARISIEAEWLEVDSLNVN